MDRCSHPFYGKKLYSWFGLTSLWRQNGFLNFIVIMGLSWKIFVGESRIFVKVSVLFGPENVADARFLQKGGKLRTELIQSVLEWGYAFQSFEDRSEYLLQADRGKILYTLLIISRGVVCDECFIWRKRFHFLKFAILSGLSGCDFS